MQADQEKYPGGATYDRDDLLLDESGQGDQFEVESKVDLEDNMLIFLKL